MRMCTAPSTTSLLFAFCTWTSSASHCPQQVPVLEQRGLCWVHRHPAHRGQRQPLRPDVPINPHLHSLHFPQEVSWATVHARLAATFRPARGCRGFLKGPNSQNTAVQLTPMAMLCATASPALSRPCPWTPPLVPLGSTTPSAPPACSKQLAVSSWPGDLQLLQRHWPQLG